MGFENGPFLAQADGGLKLSAFSWNKKATMVWFEQPAGVGFSYSDVPADYQKYNDTVAATDNAAFLTAFFAAHPQYQNLPLFLTSESYGGNYIPQLSAAVLRGADTRLAAQLKRGGFAVGNPVFSIDDKLTFAGIMNAVTADIRKCFFFRADSSASPPIPHLHSVLPPNPCIVKQCLALPFSHCPSRSGTAPRGATRRSSHPRATRSRRRCSHLRVTAGARTHSMGMAAAIICTQTLLATLRWAWR